LSKSFVKELTTIYLGYSMTAEEKEEEKIKKMAGFRAVLEKRVR
jgi:hypothetical protein